MKPDTAFRTFIAELAWPAFPDQAVANKLALLFQIEQNQWRSAEEIESRQFEQLRKILGFAATTVPHYRQRLPHVSADTKLTAATWREIPILTRKLVHEAGATLKSESVPKHHGRCHSISTSGSTGMVVEVLGTDLTSLYWQVFCLRDHLWHRRDLSATLCAIRYQRDPKLKRPEGYRAPSWGAATDNVTSTGPAINYDILLGVQHLANRLKLDNPTYLLSHPSMIGGIAAHCLEQGIQIPNLKEVRTMGESGDEFLRDLCRQAWNVPLVDMYTCQEAGYLALQCPDHQHYHVQAENVYLEIVDANGMPCLPGEVGRVLITSLNNFATPLIRYEIGDLAVAGEACSCGRGLPVLTRVMGRYRNLLTLPDGRRLWPRLGYESKLQDIAPIELMQMVQRKAEEIDVRLVMARHLTESEKEGLTSFIWKNLGHNFQLRFEYVDTLRNPNNGKIEQFISLL